MLGSLASAKQAERRGVKAGRSASVLRERQGRYLARLPTRRAEGPHGRTGADRWPVAPAPYAPNPVARASVAVAVGKASHWIAATLGKFATAVAAERCQRR